MKTTFKRIRRMLGLTQSDCAALLGVSTRTVCQWETSEVPKIATLAMETVARSFSSNAKRHAEESGKI